MAFLVAFAIVSDWLLIGAILADGALAEIGIYQFEDALWPLIAAFVVVGLFVIAASLVVRAQDSERLRFPMLIGWERGRPGRTHAILTEIGKALLFR